MNQRGKEPGLTNRPLILAVDLFMAAIVGTLHAQQSSSNSQSLKNSQSSGKGGAVESGPRTAPAAAGGYYPTLNPDEQTYFNSAAARFREVDSVTGGLPGEIGAGLGPAFNGNRCAMCHAQPAAGAGSPGLTSPQNPIPNPQVALATLDDSANSVPSFLTDAGPVREAGFITISGKKFPAPGAGVHDLYTITGRTDAGVCALARSL